MKKIYEHLVDGFNSRPLFVGLIVLLILSVVLIGLIHIHLLNGAAQLNNSIMETVNEFDLLNLVQQAAP